MYGPWDSNTENPFLVLEWNPFLIPVGEEELLNLKVNVNYFLEVPKINVECSNVGSKTVLSDVKSEHDEGWTCMEKEPPSDTHF